MNKSFAFFGRKREIDQLLTLHALGRHVLYCRACGDRKDCASTTSSAILSVVTVRRNIKPSPNLRQLGTPAWLGPSQAQPDRTQEPPVCAIYSAAANRSRLTTYREPRRGLHGSLRISASKFKFGSPAARTSRRTLGTSGQSFTSSLESRSRH